MDKNQIQTKACMFQANGDILCTNPSLEKSPAQEGDQVLPPHRFEDCNTFMQEGLRVKQQINTDIFNYQISQSSFVCTDHTFDNL